MQATRRAAWRWVAEANMLSRDMRRVRLAPVLAGLGLLSACSGGGGAAERASEPPPVPVTVAPAVQKDAPVTLRAIGNVAAYSTVSLKAQVEGRVARVYFADGRIGEILVHEGNVVKVNETVLAVINQLRPIYVEFAVPQQELDELRARMAGGELPVEAFRPAAEDHPVVGTLNFINNMVDTASGTVLLKAIFPNTNEELWPGQFVTVTLRLATRHDAVMIPSQAVQTGQDGKFVFVVQPDGTVASRPVSVGQTVGQDVIIEQGLTAGEQVVTEGQLRLAPGVRVQVKEEAA